MRKEREKITKAIISLLIPPIGKNNGSIKGVTYFKCKDKHGVFV